MTDKKYVPIQYDMNTEEKFVKDHITGARVARTANLDLGEECAVCGRNARMVLIHTQYGWCKGCAYSIGGGLCMNHEDISDEEAQKILEEHR